jgi:hypothetical protein
MIRREFLKNTGLGAGSLLAGSSLVSFLVSCTKTDIMNNGNMNMSGQLQPVTEGNISRLLPISVTVTGNTTLIAQNQASCNSWVIKAEL